MLHTIYLRTPPMMTTWMLVFQETAKLWVNVFWIVKMIQVVNQPVLRHSKMNTRNVLVRFEIPLLFFFIFLLRKNVHLDVHVMVTSVIYLKRRLS